MRIRFNYFPEGKRKALTMSYDDGQIHDLRLIEIFNKYGIKGTFHLNGSSLNKPGMVTSEDVATHYVGHEVACHMLTHPFPERIPIVEVINETLEDRKRLEAACGYIVRGMSYPFGKYSQEIINAMKPCGIEYSRTAESRAGFNPPEDFMRWHSTCHHSDDIFGKLDALVNNKWGPLQIFYIWGHSYEFPQVEGAWERMEEFCKKASEHSDKIWFATNIEIYDYIMALKTLKISADKTMVYNPTNIDVWIAADECPVKIPAGETVKLA